MTWLWVYLQQHKNKQMKESKHECMNEWMKTFIQFFGYHSFCWNKKKSNFLVLQSVSDVLQSIVDALQSVADALLWRILLISTGKQTYFIGRILNATPIFQKSLKMHVVTYDMLCILLSPIKNFTAVYLLLCIFSQFIIKLIKQLKFTFLHLRLAEVETCLSLFF